MRITGCTVSSQGIWETSNLNQKPRDVTHKTRGQRTKMTQVSPGVFGWVRAAGEAGTGAHVINSSRWTLLIARGVTHSESQKGDFKSISKMRLGVTEGRVKFQPVQMFWNIKPWMFCSSSSRKRLSQLLTSCSGARMWSAVKEELSQILKLDVQDGSQCACERPFATVRAPLTFRTVHEHEMPALYFPTNHFT